MERDGAALLDSFLGASLGLVPVDGGADLVLSRIMLVSVCVVVLNHRGSDKHGAEPEGRSPEADLVPSSDPLGTWLDFAASIRARRLFFFGLETVGDGDSAGEEIWDGVAEEGMAAILICSDSFCFFFLVDGGGDVELMDNNCDGDDIFTLLEGVACDDGCGGADDTADTFVLFFDCGLAATDSVCVAFFPFAVGSERPATGREDDVV